LTSLDLWERRKDRAGTWSRGMQQKLALARTLLHRPALVLLDEPTSGLDVQGAAAVRQALSSLAAREGVTLFLTTHNMAEVEALCQQVAVIRRGRLVAQGRPQDLRVQAGRPRLEVIGRGFHEESLRLLRERPEVAAVYRGNGTLLVDLQGETDPAALVALLVMAGAQVQEVRRTHASLEQALIQLFEEESPWPIC
jgi:ABC-2 type transport system ATP-binding protein